MRNYTVRSTYTRAESAARRAADVIVTLFLCAALVFVLFKFIWVPEITADPGVGELENGEIVIVDRLVKYFGGYAVGDIVRADIGGGMNEYRIIALGGSSVIIRGGSLYVDGRLLEEPYASNIPAELDEEAEVPTGYLLLLPDDRSEITLLSRGIIPAGDVFGEVRLRIYPLNRFNLFF